VMAPVAIPDALHVTTLDPLIERPTVGVEVP